MFLSPLSFPSSDALQPTPNLSPATCCTGTGTPSTTYIVWYSTGTTVVRIAWLCPRSRVPDAHPEYSSTGRVNNPEPKCGFQQVARGRDPKFWFRIASIAIHVYRSCYLYSSCHGSYCSSLYLSVYRASERAPSLPSSSQSSGNIFDRWMGSQDRRFFIHPSLLFRQSMPWHWQGMELN